MSHSNKNERNLWRSKNYIIPSINSKIQELKTTTNVFDSYQSSRLKLEFWIKSENRISRDLKKNKQTESNKRKAGVNENETRA